ncbi:ribosome silencing factor [Rhodocyclus tenuis]|uniref:Ribosomal silencing factor RsfS n=2 Tax=Rhodocyclus TaxID=1064 RepID=A0A6L5JZ09_RHOTE|nr:ribosome silencing factor [Rhodocyclus gracilis]MQY52575.1 ribosome silencing factor [Rhodocyclus gracilis]NJA89973.1 ribosome silencing factor [Rhodocyclus gracilis]
MDISTLEKIVVDALEDIKGHDITVLNTHRLTALFERLIVASGDSSRQVKSLAHNVQEKVREAGGQVLASEGEDNGEWVLVDLGEIVVHVMQPAVRAYYSLEELWGGETPTRLRRSAAPLPPADDSEAAQTPAA